MLNYLRVKKHYLSNEGKFAFHFAAIGAATAGAVFECLQLFVHIRRN